MEDFRTIGKRVSNWGRWGPDDERGTMNLISPEIIVAASRLVRAGRVFDLGIPFDSKGPQPGGGRINPIRLMSETGADQVIPGAFRFADDYVFMALQSGTQWDALAHVYYDDKLYNGFDATDVSVHGAAHCSIDKQGKGVIGRGVLLDIARQRGVDWLQAGRDHHGRRPPGGGRQPGRSRRNGRHPAVPDRMAAQVRHRAGPQGLHGGGAGPGHVLRGLAARP
jgi:hypothetical protein